MTTHIVVLAGVLQCRAGGRWRTETFGHTADRALPAVDTFVGINSRAVSQISTVFNLTFRSGWTCADRLTFHRTSFVVDIFIDVASVTQLAILAVCRWICRALGEWWTATFKVTLGGAASSADHGVCVLRVAQVSILSDIGWTFWDGWEPAVEFTSDHASLSTVDRDISVGNRTIPVWWLTDWAFGTGTFVVASKRAESVFCVFHLGFDDAIRPSLTVHGRTFVFLS